MSDERGAVAVTVALLMVALLGMAALVVDVGAMYQERRELQNGADAAALAMAENCARGLVSCATSYLGSTAATYLNGNALDATSNYDSGTLDLTKRTVTVNTSTRTTSGTSVIPFNFAQVLGFSGKHVTATATASWGYPNALTVLPLTIDACELETATAKATVFGNVGVLGFHSGGGNNNPSACKTNPAYQDFPGGFGWFDTTNGCQPTITLDSSGQYIASAKTGVSTPNTCDASTFQSLVVNKDILIPIYDDLSDQQGSKTQYTIIGFGAFHVQQYDMGSGGGTWTYPNDGTKVCNKQQSDTFFPPGNVQACIRGYFTQMVTPAQFTSAVGSNFGVFSISLTK